jgi:hypothetical protein
MINTPAKIPWNETKSEKIVVASCIPTSWRPTQPPMGDIMTTEFKSIYPGVIPSGQKVLNH